MHRVECGPRVDLDLIALAGGSIQIDHWLPDGEPPGIGEPVEIFDGAMVVVGYVRGRHEVDGAVRWTFHVHRAGV